MLASNAERDEVVEHLRRHAGEGRLDVDELEERVERALAARTRAELEPLLADLPRKGRRSRRRLGPREAVALGSLASALLPLLGGIAILALAPAAFAWVGWTAIGWWFFAGLPSAGVGFAWCSCVKRRSRRRRTIAV